LEGGREEEEKEGGGWKIKRPTFSSYSLMSLVSLSSFSFSQGKETGKV
jgi:hypothetical protein